MLAPYIYLSNIASTEKQTVQTGIALSKQPTPRIAATKLWLRVSQVRYPKHYCHSSRTTKAFSKIQEKDSVLKLLEKAASVLYKPSATANLGQDIGPGTIVCSHWVFNVSNIYPIDFPGVPTCGSNKYRPQCPIFCMCLFFVPTVGMHLHDI